ncbi:hypothetical protein RhiirA5_384682 [Rhizophagus irregularis]|uniref:Uncharacterized protein n=1 Tax=Rhizophagus irregularis TaxID=588596 RepID=A0A2I1EBF5_9GLOM|nr:hypothetical protein RhiirA5_384682 [Rhizophagus irregularis]PKY19468.1 hypothetical protein RhiirB3_384115 [Rhizophagus irregularis]
MPNEKKQMCIPLRLNMRVQLELNKTKFIVCIVSAEDNMKPGYVCESDVAAKIYLSASEAVNKTYNNLFNNKTRYSGPSVLEVFQNKEKVAFYHDASPTDVWKKTGILKNYNGSILFGIEHPVTINALKNYVESPICSVNEWGNIEVMSQAFEKHLKRKISVVGLNWHKFFIEWKEQESNIIELIMHLKPLYPLDHEFTDRELRAWRKMMKSVDCTNITPYKKQELKNLLNGVDKKEAEFIKENNRLKMIIEKFWRSFKETIKANKCGWDGKQRILSIIVENFGHREIQRNLVISNDLINAAKKFSRVNGPGCPAKVKPVIKRNYISDIKDKEFESFFSDKDNVTMSSYRVDPKTNLPLLYLKDDKEALWQKFEATYPDGIKRTSFMARLAGGRYIYRKDLGRLCNICNDYCYEVFDTLINLVKLNVNQESRVYKFVIFMNCFI